MLRLNLDGSIPDDNPIPGSAVYSWGHRNAQGLCHGPNGLIYSSEHGQSNHDEFNIIEPNRNYGWPEVEGICDQASEASFCSENDVYEPLAEWSPCIAVNGIEYYDHPAIPEWQNAVLMSVLGGLNAQYERLSILHMSADGTAVESEDEYFSEFNQRIRDICVNPYTGAVYVAFNGTSYPGSGPNTIKEFVNEAFVSVEERTGQQFMNIYPNPVTDTSVIEVSESLIGEMVSVYDHSGRLVMQMGITSNQIEITRDMLPAGQYYVKAASDLGMLSKSIIIQ
ncbi:MAG: T9SS type A sorting domain-containing protein [Flavobacteriales bacterium]|nr:T9SS type A sorting domain-containing protein [Flavobacteriales bacterium]